MAHLKTQATHRRQENRLQWKLRLYRRLHEVGWDREEALALLRFIDWILELSPDLDVRFRHEARQIDAEKKMQYVTTWERHGIKIGMEKGMEKGMQKGILQGEVVLLQRQLTRRFGPLPEWVEDRLEGASREELEGWADRVLEAESLEEVFA